MTKVYKHSSKFEDNNIYNNFSLQNALLIIFFIFFCGNLYAQEEPNGLVHSESDFGFSGVRAKATRAANQSNTYKDVVFVSPTPANNSCYNGTTQVTLTASAEDTHCYFTDDFEGGLSSTYWVVTPSNTTTDDGGNIWKWRQGTGSGDADDSSLSGHSGTTAHGGSKNASIFYRVNSSYTCELRFNKDLSSCSNVKVGFWYICPAWSGDYDILYFQYSTNGSSYTTLGSYSSQSNWAYASFSIPANTKYVRFYATSGFGWGIGIDDFWIDYDEPASFTWSPSGGTVSGTHNENYTVTPTSASTTYTVTNGTNTNQRTYKVLKATISGTPTVCSGSNATVNVSFVGSTPITYRITGDSSDRTLSSGTSATPTITSPSAQNYYITNLSNSYCSNSVSDKNGSATVSLKNPPSINNISAPTAICDGQKITAPSTTINQNGGTQSASGWQCSDRENGTYTNFNPTTKTWSTSENGYYIKYYSENECGTTYSNAVQVTVKPNPTIMLTKNPDATICSNATMEITASGTGTSYTWECSGTAGTSNGTGNSVYSLPAQANNYTVNCTSTLDGCTSEATTTVSIYPSLASGAGEIETGTLIRCVGATDATQLITSVTNAEGNDVHYQWYRNGVAIATNANGATYTIPSSDLSAAAGTTYHYTRKVTDACYSTPQPSDSVYTVQIVAQPSITSVSPEQGLGVCNEQPATSISVLATGGNSLNYQWYAGSTPVGTNSSSYTPFTTATGTTNYHCVVSSTYAGCNSATSSDIPVTVYRLPSVSASTFANSCTEYGLVLTATPTAGDGTISSYSWEASSPNAGTPCIASASPKHIRIKSRLPTVTPVRLRRKREAWLFIVGLMLIFRPMLQTTFTTTTKQKLVLR